MARLFGFADDHVRAITVVTADGEIRAVTAASDPDLFRDRGVTLDALPAEAVDALLATAGSDVPAPLALVESRLLGGAIGRRPQSQSPKGSGRRGRRWGLDGAVSGPTSRRPRRSPGR
jgi:hypothetical protein